MKNETIATRYMLFTRNALCKGIFFLCFFVVALVHTAACAPAKNYFPVFPSLIKNVSFWEKVYSQYSVNTVVLHDRNDLSLVYAELALLDTSLPGASRLNQKYMDSVRDTYKNALIRLGKGNPAQSETEKKIAHLFSNRGTSKVYTQAAQNLRYQRGLKERFQEGVIRSGAYIEEMKKIFAHYGLPEDLAYLPHVESSFDATAYSKFGAAGMWQFTRTTGSQYLTIDYIVDERRDPLLATHAAAKYLRSNLQELGTWPLALTAYNYGHHGMRRALNELGTYERIFNEYSKGYFKFASRNFYAEFLAAKNVAKSLELSGNLPLSRPRDSFFCHMKGYAPAQTLCTYFGIDLDTLKKWNPSLRSPVWAGEKYIPQNFKLRLPSTPSTIRLAAAIPDSLFYKNQKQSLFYKVKRGDTAGEIARRHKVSLSSLSRANNLNAHSVVYVGQTLRIPQTGGLSNNSTGPISGSAITVPVLKDSSKNLPAWAGEISEKPPKNSDLEVAKLRSSGGASVGEIHVQPEESLAAYADWLKVSERDLLEINNLKNGASIYPGQKLTLLFNRVSASEFDRQRREFLQETEEDFFNSYKITGFTTYMVAAGDTVWDICQKKFDLPLWLLKKYNANLDYNQLKHKQTLNIPLVEAL